MSKRSIDKQLLANYIRHAGGHNKVQEEREMWRIRTLELRNERVFDEWERKNRQPPLVRGCLVSDALDDEETRDHEATPPSCSRDASPHYSGDDKIKQLMKREERDPFRWGHAGFKELYPEQFLSSGEEDGKESKSKSKMTHSRKRKREMKDKRKTKRRKLKPQEKETVSSKKKKDSRDKKKKKARSKRESESESESTLSDSSEWDSERVETSNDDIHKPKRKRSRHKH